MSAKGRVSTFEFHFAASMILDGTMNLEKSKDLFLQDF